MLVFGVGSGITLALVLVVEHGVLQQIEIHDLFEYHDVGEQCIILQKLAPGVDAGFAAQTVVGVAIDAKPAAV